MNNEKTVAIEEMKNRLDNSSFIVSDENFKLPDMGEFYIDAADNAYIQEIGDLIDGKQNSSDYKTTFYTETPTVTRLGSHDREQVYFIKAKPDLSQRAKSINKYDGDTLYFSFDSIQDGGDGTKEKIFASIRNASKQILNNPENLEFGVRFLAVGAPELPHYSYEHVPLSTLDNEKKKEKYGDIKDEQSYHIHRNNQRKDDEEIDLIKMADRWVEYSVTGRRDRDRQEIKLLVSDSSDPKTVMAGKRARDLLEKMINKSDDKHVYLMLDRTILSRSNQRYPSRFGSDPFGVGLINQLREWAEQFIAGDYNRYRYAGFQMWGLDAHSRFLGMPYVRIKGVWINLSKYLIANVPEMEVFPNHTHSPIFEDNFNFASRAFQLHTLDFKNRVLADVMEEMSKRLDNRREIQNKIFNGKNFEALKDWTVTIGDCTFMVPPTSIRTVAQTTSERMPVIRAKGSIAKGAIKTERMIEMTLYFNDEYGINGYPIEVNLHNNTNKKITYHMNGLRALISQFKFTPFMPIENRYVNEILGIEAVTLVNMQVSTMPNYPKCLAAVLTVREFDYRQYMPELPVSFNEELDFTNSFANTINWQTMRYYYQRAILNGERIKDLHPNSKEYREQTYGHKTALVPMAFKSSKLGIFLAREEHLQRMLQVKLQAIRRPDDVIRLTDLEKGVAKDLSGLFKRIESLKSDQGFIDRLRAINTTEEDELLAFDGFTQSGELEVDADKKPYFYKLNKKTFAVTKSKIETQQIFNRFANYVRNYVLQLNNEIDKILLVNPKIIFWYDGYLDVNSRRPEEQYQSRAYIGIRFEIRNDYLTNIDSIEELRRGASLATGQTIDKMFPEKVITIPIGANFFANGMTPYVMEFKDTGFRLDHNHPDMAFISYCNDISATIQEFGDLPNDAVTDMKQSVDLDKLETLIYDEYGLDEIITTNFSASFGNTYNKLGVNGTEGFASQYMGGQDVAIEVVITTTSEETVSLISALPKLSAYMAREYRLVIPSSPIKIDSELTKFLGVNEVLIETLDIKTIPQIPGAWQIAIRFISVDRTLRNREALQQLNIKDPVTGHKSDENRVQMNINSYFQLDEALGKVEVYPDLELPTIQELREVGFEFIRHVLDENRAYPDPDFYFVYGHALTSQIYREAIAAIGVEPNMNEYDFEDEFGGKVTTECVNEYGFVIKDVNKISAEAKNAAEKTIDFLHNEEGPEPELLKSDLEIINVIRAADTRSWNISPAIKGVLLEESYKALLEEQERNQKDNNWLYDVLANAREASARIDSYLKAAPVGFSNAKEEKYENVNLAYRAAGRRIDRLLDSQEIEKILELLNVNMENHRNFKKIFQDVIWACACAATSRGEFAQDTRKEAWYPDLNYVGLKVTNSQDSVGLMPLKLQDMIENDSVLSNNEAVKNGIELGIYRIKMYTRDQIKRITGENVERIFPVMTGDGSLLNRSHYFIDPYLRKKDTTMADIEYYKFLCASSVSFCTEAFFRNILFMVKKMIDDKVLPNIALDTLRQEFKDELISHDNANNNPENLTRMERQKYLQFMHKSSRGIDAGKAFMASVLALTSLDENIYSMMQNREYEKLNAAVSSSITREANYSKDDLTFIFLRKMILALVGLKRIEKENLIGQGIKNPVSDYRKVLHEKKHIRAADDPFTYIKHSFYDMITTDKRGRMARAFPTFYLIFVDEGREIGLWKLHDNFYNVNSISEIQVTKSRKIAADTARIVMSNFFHTFTTEDEDINVNHRYDWRDVWNSIYNPREIYIKEQARRMRQQPLNRARLTPGIRIHIRIGYSSNAATLPIVFNGKIAEVSAGEAVEIIAQGDGIELVNPIFDNTDAHAMKNSDNFPMVRFFQNMLETGSSPKTIIDSLLTTDGGWMRKTIRNLSNGYFNNNHPFGIMHFGDPKYNLIFKNGEPTQNIFEAIAKPKWAELNPHVAEEYDMKEAPKISFELFGKSFWDILHICGSVSPDFVVGVTPFGFRSTVFHGAPRFYYAYDYFRDTDGTTILERRKPFQQYHIYTSYTDIIKNDIKATSKGLKTNAVGLYERKLSFGSREQAKVGPMYVDWDIYPEEQRSMVYDTQLYAKGAPIAGRFLPGWNRLRDAVADDKGAAQGGRSLAWRMTISALRDSIKDMYGGELIVIGDPSVKPHNRMFIHDIYENMSGCCLIEGCTHTFSADTGFTTTIYPDCVVANDDRHELAIQTLGRNAITKGITVASVMIAGSWFFGAKSTATYAGSALLINKGIAGVGSIAAKVGLQASWTKLMASSALKGFLAVVGVGATVKAAPVIAVAAALAAIQTGGIIIGGSVVYAGLERWMDKHQVLQVFPLMKNQRAYTSGLKGSRGLIYGSPSYNDPGTFERIFARLYDKENNGFSGIINWIIGAVSTQEMKDIGLRHARRTQEDHMGTPIGTEMMLETVNEMAGGIGRRAAGYRHHMLRSRINPANKSEMTEAFQKHALIDPVGVEVQKRITSENHYIKNDPVIDKALRGGLLQLLHNQGALEQRHYRSLELDISGERTTVLALVSTRNGKEMYDVPFLKEAALDVLKGILQSKAKIMGWSFDEVHEQPEDFVLLHSALKVGDRETFSSTGFSFVLQACSVNGNNDILERAIKAVQDECLELKKKYPLAAEKLFDYQKIGKDMFKITVLPESMGREE